MKKGKDFARTVFMISLSMSVIAGAIVWLINSKGNIEFSELLLMAGLAVVVGFALFLAFRRMRDVKSQLPAEDEFSKKLMQKGAATSYYLSLYWWLALMFFEERISLDRSDLFGAGLVGMAVLFALSWIYHRYIRPSHD